ncbi:MAG TPA: hypothetical protein VIT43_09665 [Candidatus Dormibacteraeota bacterium]
MLEGIKHDQRPPSGQARDQHFLKTWAGFDCTNHLGKLGRDQFGVLYVAQRDEEHAVGPGRLDLASSLHSESRLADAAWPGEGEEAHRTAKKCGFDGCKVPRSTNE